MKGAGVAAVANDATVVVDEDRARRKAWGAAQYYEREHQAAREAVEKLGGKVDKLRAAVRAAQEQLDAANDELVAAEVRLADAKAQVL